MLYCALLACNVTQLRCDDLSRWNQNGHPCTKKEHLADVAETFSSSLAQGTFFAPTHPEIRQLKFHMTKQAQQGDKTFQRLHYQNSRVGMFSQKMFLQIFF